jgi:peptide/nickel transport system substrate-binding protein
MASRPKSTSVRALMAAILLLALIAAGVLAFGPARAGADETPAATAAATTDGTITLDSGWTEEPDNLNPFIGYTLTAYHIFWENYDRLVRYDADTMEPVPGIAESWDVSDDAKTWTFHIRHDVKWQDDEDLTARDVAFTFNYVIANGPNAFTIYTNHIRKVTATDDYTVVFECSQPRGTLLQMWVPILPEHIWGKISPDDAQNSFPNKPPIVGSGPFQVVEWKKGNFVRMKAWDGYWGGRAKIDEMILHFYTNPDTLAADFDLGVIDMTNQMAAAKFPSYENKPGVESQQAVHDKFDCLELNCYEGASGGHPALKDPTFRQALAWAIDVEKICEVAYMGFSTPGTSILPSDFWKDPLDYHWDPPADVKRTYDPEKAKQLLDEAGYTDGDGDGIREYKGKPIKLRLWGDPEVASDSTTGKMLTSWFEDVGIDIDFEVIDYGWQMDQVFNYKGDVYYPDWDMSITYWGGDYDPGFILSVYTGDQIESWNDTGWANEEYDQLYKEQDATLDSNERLDMIHRMQEICYDQVPVIAFGYSKDLDVHNTADWEGWVKMPAGNGSVANMWNYLSVQPKEGGGGEDEGANTGLIVGIVAAVGAIGVVAALLITRQRKAARREED